MHPDHVGGAADVAAVRARRCCRGGRTTSSACNAWGDRNPQRFVDYWVSHGMPAEDVAGIARESERLGHAVHWVRDPQLLDAGDEIDGWRVEVLPGHADGHIVLLRDGVMIAGDTILGGITPAIGLYPNSRPDPLGDYLETLRPDRVDGAADRVRRAQGADPRSRGPCARDHRAPSRAARRHRRRARRRAALGVRRLARALRARPVAGAPAVRDRRVARAPRAPRAGGARAAGRPQARRPALCSSVRTVRTARRADTISPWSR